MTRRALSLLSLLCATTPHVGRLEAQQPPQEGDLTIDAAVRAAVVEQAVDQLRRSYVFPDRAEAMASALRERMRRREYDGITSARAFAETLTEHLQAVSSDKHLRVRFSPQPLPDRRPGQEPPAGARERDRQMLRALNFGFERVERLPGNVGYLELRGFMEGEGVEETLAAAMGFLANTDALIVDLRRNGGGSPRTVSKLASYLFGPEPVHLNSLYWRPTDRTDHFWTERELRGPRYGTDKPVYVLTSRRTFSGAEEFAYNLQTQKRGTLVGETTGGGAHPGGMEKLHAHFAMFVPSGRAINPITKTNWEGTGVRPEVAVPAERALATAHAAAIRALLDGATDPEHRRMLEGALREVEGGSAPATR